MHADHFIWSTYGTWMPNCPRESWPRYIYSWEKGRLEPKNDPAEIADAIAQPDPYRVNRLAAEKSRRFPAVQFSSIQIKAVAEGFERCLRSRHAWVWACSILPNYVQLLVTCPRTPTSQIIGFLRSEATRRLNELDLHPMRNYVSAGQTPLMWSHIKWHQQLKDDQAIREAIRYINGLTQPSVNRSSDSYDSTDPTDSNRQSWPFLKEFHGLKQCREENEEYQYESMAG